MATTDRLLGLSGGVALKAPVVVASTGNLTLSSSQTIDGIVVGTSDDEGTRVLVKDQTDPKENGVYVSSATWTRAKDFDGKRDALPGSLIYVDRGTANGKTFWAFNSSSTASSITVGSTGDNITVSQVTQALGVIPLTTEGDILAYISGSATRLAIGATNTVLISTGTVPSWSLIGSDNISTNAITAEKISSSAVTTTKIANSAVTGPKISISGESSGDIPYFDGSTWTTLAAGTTSQVLYGGPQWGGLPTNHVEVLDADPTEVEIVNTLTETTAYSFSIPANTLGTDKSVRLRLAGSVLINAASGSATIKVKYGATTLYNAGTGTVATNSNERAWWAEIILTAVDSASAQAVQGIMGTSAAGAATTGFGVLSGGLATASWGGIFGGSATEDSSGALTFSVTFAWDTASTALSFKRKYATLELLP